MAFPQDYAAMMTMIEKLQQIPKVVGIDIGGFTTDYLLMRKGNPDMEACDSMEKGVITMYNKIISGINSEYDILLEESDIDSILQGNTEFYEEAEMCIRDRKQCVWFLQTRSALLLEDLEPAKQRF